MNDSEFLEQTMRYQDGALAPDEIVTFEAVMRGDASKRKLFFEAQLRSVALYERFRQEAFQHPPAPVPQKPRVTWIARPITAMAAGLVIGLFSASFVWAIAAPKATTERLFTLLDGSFEKNHVETGFPKGTGLWSGDAAEISASAAKDGRQCLRFLRPGSDQSNSSGRAISCDVFQLVDLRPLRSLLDHEGNSVLELSASFLDARPHNTNPSVTFFCQLFLFKGDASARHQTWPINHTEAISSASSEVTTLGGSPGAWRTLSTKCLMPPEADFAVIQIAARPNIRPAKLDSLFADDVQLTLKTQPTLPVKVVHR